MGVREVTLAGARDVRLVACVHPAADQAGEKVGGPAILLVHGFQEHSGRYVELAGELSGAGFDVVRFDLRGHGRSGGRRGDVRDFEDFLVDVDRVFEAAVAPDARRFLLGHSLGGLIALRWVQTRGRDLLSGLVLSAPWLGTAIPVGRATRALKAFLDAVAPGLPTPRPLNPADLTRDPERQELHRKDRMKHQRVTARLVTQVEEAQARALTGGGPGECLVLLPGADPIADSEVTRRYANGLDPAPEVLDLPHGVHEPFQDVDRARVTGETCAWLKARLH
jgi:alpha-beta hydrolase superfamily lysophospholipase